MKRIFGAIGLFLAVGLASLDADAARRFGGGGSFGKQRAIPTQRQATPPAPAPGQAAPAKPAAAPAAAGAGAAAAKPGFMGRWGGLLAGLGIGALLASLFGAQLGPIIGLLLAVMLAVGVIYLLLRLFAGKRPPAAGRSPQFAGIGSGVPEAQRSEFQGHAAGSSVAAPTAPGLPADFDVQPFLRVAKSSFIRLQAASDAGDLADIRDYTTPEIFAEISLQMQERSGAAQKTEVVSLEAQLLDVAQEDGFDYAGVRFYGLIRENDAANPEPFDEVWHVRRRAGDRRDPWLIAGIQQNPQ